LQFNPRPGQLFPNTDQSVLDNSQFGLSPLTFWNGRHGRVNPVRDGVDFQLGRGFLIGQLTNTGS
jgi:hypothetical protein